MAVTYAVLWGLNSDALRPHLTWQFLWRQGGLVLAIVAIVAAAAFTAPHHPSVFAFVPAMAVALVASYVCAKQFAYWMTVNPAVDWREMRLWQSLWPRLWTTALPNECPEMLTARAAIVALAVQAWLGYEVLHWLMRSDRNPELQTSAGLIALTAIIVPLPCYWLLWHVSGIVPRISWRATLIATFASLHVWFSYLPTPTQAPGVFFFPDRWLRPLWVRQVVAIFALASMTTGILLLQTSPSRTAPVTLVLTAAQLIFGPQPSSAGFTSSQLTLATALAAMIPILVFLAIYWFVFGSLLARYWLALEVPGGSAQCTTKSPWSISVNRMLNSRDRKEREHVLLGRSIFGGYPVLLHKALLHQHAHLVGDSGSRKTSLGIAPIIAQLVAAQDCSVLVLDLKGDRSLFETARLEAAAAGAEFRWFALETGLSSHVFNPLEQSHFARLTPNQKTQLILEGLSLNYGDAYGRGFFSAMNEVVLLNLIRHYPIPNFQRLHALLCDKAAYLAAGGNPDDWKKAQHVTALVDRLASIYALNVTAEDLRQQPRVREAAIDMGMMLSRPQVAYFNLKSPIEPIGSPAVAKLAMYSLFSAAARRTARQRQRIYVVVDEFQQIVSDSVRLVFEQARSSNVHFIVAHQNVEQLDRKGVDVRDTVSSCTAFKQFFRASDPKTIKLLEEMSGQGRFEALSWKQQFTADDDQSFTPDHAEFQLVGVNEEVGFRLERNTIMDISAAPNTSFISVTEASHFTQFSGYVTPIISDYHISLKEYDRRSSTAWPTASDETVLIPDAAGPASGPPLSSPSADDDWDERIRKLSEPNEPSR